MEICIHIAVQNCSSGFFFLLNIYAHADSVTNVDIGSLVFVHSHAFEFDFNSIALAISFWNYKIGEQGCHDTHVWKLREFARAQAHCNRTKKMVMKHYYGIFLRFRVRILSTALSRDGQNRYHADHAEGSFFHWAARRTHSDLKLRIPIGNSQVSNVLFIGFARDWIPTTKQQMSAELFRCFSLLSNANWSFI